MKTFGEIAMSVTNLEKNLTSTIVSPINGDVANSLDSNTIDSLVTQFGTPLMVLDCDVVRQ